MRLHNPSQSGQRAREYNGKPVPKSAQRFGHIATYFAHAGQQDVAAELTSRLRPIHRAEVLK